MACTRLIFRLAWQQHAVLRENYEKEDSYANWTSVKKYAGKLIYTNGFATQCRLTL